MELLSGWKVTTASRIHLTPGWYHALHRAPGLLWRKNACADEGPAWLVEMLVGRLDDRDIKVAYAREQARGDRDAAGAAPDDDNLVAREARSRLNNRVFPDLGLDPGRPKSVEPKSSMRARQIETMRHTNEILRHSKPHGRFIPSRRG